nr:unnamed protein product [Haemonchus contortus]
MFIMSLMSLMVTTTATKRNDTAIRLDMCRTLLEAEKCNRTMPIMNGHYPATSLTDRLVIRISPDRGGLLRYT